MPTVAELQAFHERLMRITDLSRFPDDEAFQLLGNLIDLSGDFHRDDGITKALVWCDELEKRSLGGEHLLLLDYFRANAWANRGSVRHADLNVAWSWDQPETVQQILYLRSAMRRTEFNRWGSIRQAQVLTNLANQLNSLGRFVEAVSLWGRALLVHPNFGMALGNRGLGLFEYARSLYDSGHQCAFLLAAHSDLGAALSEAAVYEDGYASDGAKAAFSKKKAIIEELLDLEKVRDGIRWDSYELGASAEERGYRKWALENALFLNPLNDLAPHSIAARDVFTLPTFTTHIDEPPTLVGLFNQMKQEYVSARWMLYDGLTADGPHFSDRDVLLHNTLDYPSYSLSVEKTKAAYRVAYALFDKIAFFLNDYLKMGVPLKRVYFRRIWYQNQYAKNGGIRDEFSNLRNWPWRGLFWLSKDLFDPDLQDSAEPDAQELYVIRNCLEHSYLKVHEMLVPRVSDSNLWHDRLAYSVQREDFFRKALRVLKLSRAALVYLSLGMHREERKRAETTPQGLAMPMNLELWQDDWQA